jgi:hypothetical protein
LPHNPIGFYLRASHFCYLGVQRFEAGSQRRTSTAS